MFTGFAWNPIGVILVPTPLIKFGGLLGTYGLSALVVLLSIALWMELLKKWLAASAIIGVTFILWLLPLSNVPETELVVKPIRVVQPAIGQQDKWRPGFSEIAAERLARLSLLPGGARPRLLLWPEAAVTNPMEDQRENPWSAFAEFERRRAAAAVGPGEFLLTGGIALFSPDGQRVTGAGNGIYVLGQGGKVVGRYYKAHLVPYGEYLPMRPLLEPLGLAQGQGQSNSLAGARWDSSFAMKSSSQAMCSMNATDRTSFSIRPTTHGSAPGVLPNTSLRRGSAPPRRAFR
jgi:apolipoprotein N-acyltransferase